eukprot:CAMPEP_0174253222 /NCGR_PEP_ID=MMETSP0439-20130205/2600_1 /TAXON_ID=0 /ORGANISM="Stereomyxa ramosa, Strain Chinc5" /LENGTH=524 /DNA_ID=CAMNT_0015334131 /DNA_START=20 /DNA_END=1594 /DNA_ORIENTATION=-
MLSKTKRMFNRDGPKKGKEKAETESGNASSDSHNYSPNQSPSHSDSGGSPQTSPSPSQGKQPAWTVNNWLALEAKAIFQRRDLDGNHLLESDELFPAISEVDRLLNYHFPNVHKGLTDESSFRQVIKDFDSDGDGNLDIDEFTNLVITLYQSQSLKQEFLNLNRLPQRQQYNYNSQYPQYQTQSNSPIQYVQPHYQPPPPQFGYGMPYGHYPPMVQVQPPSYNPHQHQHQHQHQPQQQQQQQYGQLSPSGYVPSSPQTDAGEWEVPHEELEIESEIARGSFGVVSKGTFRGTDVAIKKLIQQRLSPEQKKEFLDEIAVMKKLHHPNVVLLIGVCTTPPNLAIVNELMTGSMWDLLHDKNCRIDYKLQVKLLLDTAKGMNYLHLFKPHAILHRDLKSANLLVDSNFNVKITDFGLTRVKAQVMTGNVGTPHYMAPEVIQNQGYTEKADVYSYAVVIWEVLTRMGPYPGMRPLQIAFQVINNHLRPQIPQNAPPALVNLMTASWHDNPHNRPTFTDILKELKKISV